MKRYVVTESRFEADLLRRVLDSCMGEETTEVRDGGDRSSAVGLASAFASTRDRPTVLVLDAETTSDRSIEEQRLVVGELLRLGSPASPIHLVFARPRVEAVLFRDADALARILGTPLSAEERIHAIYRPREILDDLLARATLVKSQEELLCRVDPETARRMATHPLVKEIASAIESWAEAALR